MRTWTASFFLGLGILIGAFLAHAGENRGLSQLMLNPHINVASNLSRSQLDEKSEFNIDSKTGEGLSRGLTCQDFEYLKGICFSVKSFIEEQGVE